MPEAIKVAELYNTSKAVDTNFFASNLGISGKVHQAWEPVLHHIYVTLHGTTASLLKTFAGNEATTNILNLGATLVAQVEYHIVVPVFQGDTYNLTYTGVAGPQNVSCRVFESLMP